MMVVHRETGRIDIRTFRDLPGYFGPGDVIVVNDSRVFPARLIGRKETGGLIEILLLTRQTSRETPEETWEVLLRPAKRVADRDDDHFRRRLPGHGSSAACRKNSGC